MVLRPNERPFPRRACVRGLGYSLINARSETAASKPAFRDAFRDRRCLILTDGFCEWQKLDGRKQPYHIRRCDGKPFTFAGLWER
jgi:putative SOS response-associated peptidase YedK